MQAQDSTTLYLFKFWDWVEANRNRVIGGVIALAVVALVVWFMISQSAAKEVAAGEAMTQVVLSPAAMQADSFFKIANEYPGLVTGQRAQLQGAAVLFDAGKFSDAQAAFQKYLDAHPDGQFSGTAQLGVAASLDAQGKSDLAAGAYQRLINSSSDVAAVNAAKFALAQIEESQGRLTDALSHYQDVANANAGTSLGNEAALRFVELRNKMPATPAAAAKPATTPALPLKTGQ